MKLYIVGFMAAGKTTFGKKLARSLNHPFVDLDAEIVKAHGSIDQIFSAYGERKFREWESKALKSDPMRSFVMATGGGTICFRENHLFMRENGIVLYLNTPWEIIENRLMDTGNFISRPLLATHNLTEIKSLYQKRMPYYQKADLEFGPEDNFELLIHKLKGL